MTSLHGTQGDLPEEAGREVDDLVTRLFDGGLDDAGQRRLAKLLDASPRARETLSRYMRLEGALIRLASARLIGGPARERSAVEPQRLSATAAPKRRRVAWALAAGPLAAALVAAIAIGWLSIGQPPGVDVAVVADRWLELRAADGGVEPERLDPERHDAGDDEAESMPGAPPAWLVAAVADEVTGQPHPDDG